MIDWNGDGRTDPAETAFSFDLLRNGSRPAMNGWDYERLCADYLRAAGYRDVQVTSGSGDQGVDVLARKDGRSFAFQCKYYSGAVGNRAVQEVYAGAKYYDREQAAVITNSTFTRAAAELAGRTGVELMPGMTEEKLRAYIRRKRRPSCSVRTRERTPRQAVRAERKAAPPLRWAGPADVWLSRNPEPVLADLRQDRRPFCAVTTVWAICVGLFFVALALGLIPLLIPAGLSVLALIIPMLLTAPRSRVTVTERHILISPDHLRLWAEPRTALDHVYRRGGRLCFVFQNGSLRKCHWVPGWEALSPPAPANIGGQHEADL